MDYIKDPGMKTQIANAMDKIGISPDAIGQAMAYAIGQPANVDAGEIIIRATAQG